MKSIKTPLPPVTVCGDCNAPATWLRITQFAGAHRFCDAHARKEPDFGKEDPSSFFWEPMSPPEDQSPPPMHVDDFIEDFQQDAYARFFFHLHRLPAAMKNDFSPWTKQFQLYCTYLGSRFRVVGASRMGDVWLNANFKEDMSYELRVDVEKCSAWGPKP